MAELNLKRFSTLESYNLNKSDIKDGEFFIINETEQLGTRCHDKSGIDKIFLTPSNILHGYALPEGELVITENDTISEAIGKLESYINSLEPLVKDAFLKADNAFKSVEEFNNLDISDSDAVLYALSSRIRNLEEKDVILSEADYESLDYIDPNKIYYIYEND